MRILRGAKTAEPAAPPAAVPAAEPVISAAPSAADARRYASPPDLTGVRCPVCGASSWEHNHVLWPALIEEWGLSPAEADSVDRQQGTHCTQCNASLRAAALARALLLAAQATGTLQSWAASAPGQRVLEVNEAASLTPTLRQLPGHRLVEWPEVDLQALPFTGGRWDLLVHSDTLEHVPDPAKALRECLRVLSPGGAMVFTTPVVPGRMTRRRDGLPASYHGLEKDPIYLVVSEFGADFWPLLFDAGFDDVRTVSFAWPDAIAYVARKTP